MDKPTMLPNRNDRKRKEGEHNNNNKPLCDVFWKKKNQKKTQPASKRPSKHTREKKIRRYVRACILQKNERDVERERKKKERKRRCTSTQIHTHTYAMNEHRTFISLLLLLLVKDSVISLSMV